MQRFCVSNNEDYLQLIQSTTINVDFGCILSFSPEVYGLSDFLLRISTSLEQGGFRYKFTVRFANLPNSPTTEASVLTIPVIGDLNLDPSTIETSGLVRGTSVTNIEGESKRFFNIVVGRSGFQTARYTVTFETDPNTGNPSIPPRSVTITPSENQILIPAPPGAGTHFIKASALLTPDNEQICQLSYLVNKRNCEFRTILEYVQYCPNVASVLKSEGCTFSDKAENLKIDFESLIVYSSLRLILSQILFGSFNIKWLKQKYYERFLCLLQQSEFSVYYDYFVCKNVSVPCNPETWKLFL